MAIKSWGETNIVKGDSKYVADAYSHIEGIYTSDNVIPYDINRPLRNIYEVEYELYNFLENLVKNTSTSKGVIKNSFTSAFAFDDATNQDVYSVVLNGDSRHYARLSPGIAYNNENLVVVKPQTHIAERQIAEILGLVEGDSETVNITYTFSTDKYTALIYKINNAGILTEHSFVSGYDSGGKLLEAIYNDAIFQATIHAALNRDLTKITLEPIGLVATATDYYWNIQSDGSINLDGDTAGDTELGLSHFTVTITTGQASAGSVGDDRTFYQNFNDFEANVFLNVPNFGDSNTSGITDPIGDSSVDYSKITNQNSFITIFKQDTGSNDNVVFGWHGDTISGVAPERTEKFFVNKDFLAHFGAGDTRGKSWVSLDELTGDSWDFYGIKTFKSIPVLPASDPTTDNQAARKAYVDAGDSLVGDSLALHIGDNITTSNTVHGITLVDAIT